MSRSSRRAAGQPTMRSGRGIALLESLAEKGSCGFGGDDAMFRVAKIFAQVSGRGG